MVQLMKFLCFFHNRSNNYYHFIKKYLVRELEGELGCLAFTVPIEEHKF